MHLIINVLGFKLGWASSVFGAANGLPTLGPIVVLLLVGVHLYLASDASKEFLLILIATTIGAAWDSLLVTAGWLSYSTGMIANGVAPYWIVGMWMLFATTLNVAMHWFRSKLAFGALAGAVMGPLSYFIGSRIGAVTIVDQTSAFVALAIGWAFLMPVLLLLARHFDGVSPAATEASA